MRRSWGMQPAGSPGVATGTEVTPTTSFSSVQVAAKALPYLGECKCFGVEEQVEMRRPLATPDELALRYIK